MLAGLGMVGLTSACSTVSPDELDSDLSALRAEMMEEMEAGDEQVTQQMDGRLSSIEERLSALESDLNEMERNFEVTVQRLEDQLRFDVPVYFGFDDATLTADARPILDRFAAVADEYYPDALVTVEGFTDPSGPAAYNQQLGQSRADTVRDYLVEGASLSEDRIRAVSYGEDSSRLVQPDETGPGQTGWQNRRVVLVIDHQGEPPTVSTEEQQGSTK